MGIFNSNFKLTQFPKYSTTPIRLLLTCEHYNILKNLFIFCQVWPGVQDLELYSKMDLPMGHKRKVKDRLKAYVKDPHGCDLLDKLLQLDPRQRIDADAALNHDVSNVRYYSVHCLTIRGKKTNATQIFLSLILVHSFSGAIQCPAI